MVVTDQVDHLALLVAASGRESKWKGAAGMSREVAAGAAGQVQAAALRDMAHMPASANNAAPAAPPPKGANEPADQQALTAGQTA